MLRKTMEFWTMEIKEVVILWGHAEADNTLFDLYNSSDDTKAKFDNCYIIHSK